MGRLTGFEPATFGTTIQRSNQLSYNRHKFEGHILSQRGPFCQERASSRREDLPYLRNSANLFSYEKYCIS